MEEQIQIIQKLDMIISKLDNLSAGDRWMDIKAVCQYTGLSAATIYNNLAAGKLESNNRSGKHLFRKSWIDDFLESK